MSEELKMEIALTALNDMMGKGYFDICCIDKVGKLLGRDPRGTEPYIMLSPLHCVDWNKMSPGLRDSIPGLIESCLGVAPAYRFKTVEPGRIIDITPPRESKQERRGFLRLLGGRHD